MSLQQRASVTTLIGRKQRHSLELDRRMRQLRERSQLTHGTIFDATRKYEEAFSSSMSSDWWEKAHGLKSSWHLQRSTSGYSSAGLLEIPGWTIVLYLLPTGFTRIVQISYGDMLSTISLPNSPQSTVMSIQAFLHGVGNKFLCTCPTLGELYDISRQSPSGAIKIFLKG